MNTVRSVIDISTALQEDAKISGGFLGMHHQRKKRLYSVLWILGGLSLTLALVLYALRQNISLYYTPSDLSKIHLSSVPVIYVGGTVVTHSVRYITHPWKIRFALTDAHQQLWVTYQGLLPALFREGQGIVVRGHLVSDHLFRADQVLAKHDENYYPLDLWKKRSAALQTHSQSSLTQMSTPVALSSAPCISSFSISPVFRNKLLRFR